MLVSSRQRGNPLLELIRHVVWEYAEIEPDYVFGPTQCGFFLSLRYHNLNPGYIFERLQKLTSAYKLIVLIVLVDVLRQSPVRVLACFQPVTSAHARLDVNPIAEGSRAKAKSFLSAMTNI
ncbi:unnamed protein product [Rodentolepis nana]|uniref:ERCC1-like central domain-containing protein n=1 Tax=Rodentolepis nana TaxID=102285 RepID=A0A3P7S3U4_RODNA|nr:unnamed protein product [Rodentolepis nana]